MGPAGQRRCPGVRRRWPAVSRTELPDQRYGNAPVLCRQICAGFTPAPTELLLAQQHWTPIRRQPGWEQCEFTHQAHGWSCPRFFVAVRCPQEDTADTLQTELLPVARYDAFCYVTSEPLSPWSAHRTDGQRATSETWIEEAKNPMGLAHLKTDHFLANAAPFQCAVLADNTLRWMALLSGNTELQRWEPQSIRLHLIRVAGKLLTGANQLRLKLAQPPLARQVWQDWLALSQPA